MYLSGSSLSFFFCLLLSYFFFFLPSILLFKFFNQLYHIFQILFTLPSVFFRCTALPSYQVFVSFPYLPLVHNFLDLPFLFSFNFHQLWHLFLLPLYLQLVLSYSTNIYYWMYFDCTRQIQFYCITGNYCLYSVKFYKVFCKFLHLFSDHLVL